MTGVRRTAWFPPALLGFLLLGLLSWELSHSRGWFAFAPYADLRATGFRQQFLSADSYGEPLLAVRSPGLPALLGEYWLVVLVVAFLVTMAWYAVHTRRGGVPIPARTLILVTLGGLALITFGALLRVAVRSTDERVIAVLVATGAGLIGLGAGGWAVFRPGPQRRQAAIACLLLVLLAAYGFAAAASVDLVDPLTVVVGLALLAWLEHSRPLAVTTMVFALAAVAFSASLLALLVPAAVLLAGAIATLLTAAPPVKT